MFTWLFIIHKFGLFSKQTLKLTFLCNAGQIGQHAMRSEINLKYTKKTMKSNGTHGRIPNT